MISTLLLLAKQPLPGFAKTRLSPMISPIDAARLARAAIDQTMSVLLQVPARRRVLVFDGDPSGFGGSGFDMLPQVSGGLDRRLAAAFEAVRADGPALLVGMDTPQLQPDSMEFDPAVHDSCLGLAHDGGFWAIGFRDPGHANVVIPGVAMSLPSTGMDQLARMRSANLSPLLLPELTDFDTPDDLLTVAAASPGSAFAALVTRVMAG